jgi:Ni,Fe-hydrogenase III component G
MSERAEQCIAIVREEYDGEILESGTAGQYEVVFTVPAEQIVQFATYIVNRGWWHLATITGQDLGEQIQMLYHFNAEEPPAVTIKAAVPKSDPRLPSITPQLPAATMYEREIFDLLGVQFEGHPRLERLVLSDDWPEGVYPLRLEELAKQAERDEEEKA